LGKKKELCHNQAPRRKQGQQRRQKVNASSKRDSGGKDITPKEVVGKRRTKKNPERAQRDR